MAAKRTMTGAGGDADGPVPTPISRRAFLGGAAAFGGVAGHLDLAPCLFDTAVGTDQVGGALHPHIFAAVHRLFDPGAERVGHAAVLV